MDSRLTNAESLSATSQFELVLKTALRAVVSVVLLIWLFRKADFSEVLSAFAGAGWISLCIVWAVQTLLALVQTERWRIVAEQLSIKFGFWPACQNIYIGQFFNQVLPSSFGGDAVRVWRLTRCYVPTDTAFASVVLDRLVALTAVPLIALFGVGVLLQIEPPRLLALGLTVLVGGCAVGLLMLVSLDRIAWPARLMKLGVARVLRELPAAARRVFLDWGCISRTILLSLVIHAGVGTSFWLLALSLGFDASLVQFLVLAPIIMLVTAVPISLGGWGVREGATVTALTMIGAPTSTALTISILFGLVMIAVGLPGGLIWLLDADRRSARQIGDERWLLLRRNGNGNASSPQSRL